MVERVHALTVDSGDANREAVDQMVVPKTALAVHRKTAFPRAELAELGSLVTLRRRKVDSNFRFRVRCKCGLRRKSPASAACSRRSSVAAVGGHQLGRKAKSRNQTLAARRTGSSNPPPSSGESGANLSERTCVAGR